MQVTAKNDQFLHSKLPIDQDEKILAIYRHHWFAYASSWLVGILLVIVLMGVAIGLTMLGGNDSSLAQYRPEVFAGVSVLCVLILIGTFIPVYLRSQEQLVLTQEALLQVLQPSLFASKVDQVSLQRIDDVSVRQDFLGTMLGYGHITIETPGEQDNYEFLMLPKPHEAIREITSAKEDYEAALESGRLHTTLGESQPQAPVIDPQQYQQFLEYQKWQAEQQQAQAQPAQQAAEQAAQDNEPTQLQQ